MSPAYVILGATGGIGREVCTQLSQAGSSVVLGGRNEEKLQTLASQVKGVAMPLNATEPDEVESCVRHCLETYDRLDGIINCVGSLLLKPAHLTSAKEWDDVIETNLRSAFATVRAGAKNLRKAGGSIVLVASAAADIGLPNHEAIAAAKAGVIGLTKSAAATYANKGIRVNAVAPGLVATPMTERITQNETAAQASRELHPLGRLGEPADVARAICWLADPEQSWVTGQVLGVDGGLATLKVKGR